VTRRRAAALACTALLTACTDTTGSGQASADVAGIRDARETLGAPTVALADALLAAAAAVDSVRHDVARGMETAAAAQALNGPLDELRAAALAADAAARPLLGDDRIGRAAEVVSSAAEVALEAADQGAAQAAALERLSGWDQRMTEAVVAWTVPGSQSERREQLSALAGELDAIAEQAAAEQPVPEGCPAFRDARERWAGRLADQTRELAASATSGGGGTFDELLERYQADPFGEDRLAVDATDRECWARQSTLAQAAAGIRQQVETLEALLQA
jgi:hypothetical protein